MDGEQLVIPNHAHGAGTHDPTHNGYPQHDHMPPGEMAEVSWYLDHRELVGFANALYEAGEFSDVRGVLNFIEKPWNWDASNQAWTDLGKPNEESGEAWDSFLEFLGDRP